MEFTYSLQQLDEAAKWIIEQSSHKHILFYGAMGSGKTTLIKALVQTLGSDDVVSSPTFSIVNEYATSNDRPIFHFDFYRISEEIEAEQLGLFEYYEIAQRTFIEWPENINSFLPSPAHTAKIESLKNDKRLLTFS